MGCSDVLQKQKKKKTKKKEPNSNGLQPKSDGLQPRRRERRRRRRRRRTRRRTREVQKLAQEIEWFVKKTFAAAMAGSMLVGLKKSNTTWDPKIDVRLSSSIGATASPSPPSFWETLVSGPRGW